MKKSFQIFFALILLSCSKDKPMSLNVVHLEGSAYNRGLIHGQVLKDEIHIIVHQWIQQITTMHQQNFEETQRQFLDRTRYRDSILRECPHFMEEVKGIADGSGIDFDTIFLFQISEELESNLKGMSSFRCTSIGVNKTAESPCYVAQNMDPPYFLHGFPTLLHIRYPDSDLESYIFTSPGLLALNGMNNKGIGIVANGLPDLYYQREGLPVAFVIRSVLEKRSFQEALDFLHQIKHAKSQNYILGGPDEAVCLECFDDQISRFIPPESAGLTYHTNHYLAIKHTSNSKYCSRLATLREEIDKRNYRITLEDIKDILRSTKWNAGRPISHSFTYGSTIMELSDHPVLYITPDQPDKMKYLIYGFD